MGNRMGAMRVGLVADPDAPTDIARRLADDGGLGRRRAWDVTVVSEPFTTGSEDVGAAAERLRRHGRQHEWDLVVGLTELPLHDDEGRPLLVETDREHRTAVLSLPALGGVRVKARARRALDALVDEMTGPSSSGPGRPRLPRPPGRVRLLMGMVLANRPWLLVPGLKSALVAALATGAVATVNSTVWVLASSLSWWRLVVAMLVSVAVVVVWLIVDAGLWDRPSEDSVRARHRSRLYNASTVVSLMTGVVICYLALYTVNLLWALFILDPEVMGRDLRATVGYGDLFVLSWLVSSAATVGGGLGSGFESEETVRAAAYSKREEERRNRLEAKGE